MPKLTGLIRYQFVEPGYVHPDGWKVEVIGPEHVQSGNFDELVEGMASRQAAYADLCELEAEICTKYGHRAPHDGRLPSERTDMTSIGCGFDASTPRLWKCRQRAADQRSYTRTAERTVLVRVYIP